MSKELCCKVILLLVRRKISVRNKETVDMIYLGHVIPSNARMHRSKSRDVETELLVAITCAT